MLPQAFCVVFLDRTLSVSSSMTGARPSDDERCKIMVEGLEHRALINEQINKYYKYNVCECAYEYVSGKVERERKKKEEGRREREGEGK